MVADSITAALGLGGDSIICLECSDVRWQNISFDGTSQI